MAAVKLLLLLLPIFASAKIQVNIVAGKTYSETTVTLSGFSEHIITDKDREIFQLRDWELKQAVFALSGGRPDDVYVRGPTPLRWGDLYSGNGWNQIKRKLVPKYSKVVKVESEPKVVARKHFSNNSTSPSGYGGTLTQEVDMTVTNSWSASSSYGISDDISYGISLGGYATIGGTRSISYTNQIGREHSVSSGKSVGSEISVSPNLKPGESVNVVLTATRGVVQVEVTYEATLSGDVACNYAGKYRGHHFYHHDVNACLQAAGKPKEIETKELIDIAFYFDEEVIST